MPDSSSRRKRIEDAYESASREELLARIAALEAERDGTSGSADGVQEQTESLMRNAQRLRSLADTAPAMLWVTDSENRCTFLSRAWYEFTGQTEAEGAGFGWLDAVHPDDRERAEHDFMVMSAQRLPLSLDHRLRRYDGSYRWVVDEGRPRFDENGDWRGYVGAVIDVHDRTRVAEALRKSEIRYRALFDSIDEGFCIIEVLRDQQRQPIDYRFLETNPAFVKQTGLENAIGRTARSLLPDLEQHWIETYGEVAESGRPVRFENGSDAMGRWFDVFAFRVEEPGSNQVALLFKDITAHRTAASERERLLRVAEDARREAEAANRAKAEFLAAMSHELRTPLNATVGYLELLTMGIHGPLLDAQREALGRIAANQRHLLSLITDILSFARLEAGRIEFDAGEINVVKTVASVESLIAPQAEARGIDYSVQSCDPGLCFRGDAERVRQILLNLVGNAIKFTPEGGRVILSCDADDHWVHFHVRDNGPGIPVEQQERIFDPFQQVDRRLNHPQEGVGLGLAISRDLARAMAGDLTVRSEPGGGSAFTLRIPRVHSSS
jgi:PAS domain S-box-containing protein